MARIKNQVESDAEVRVREGEGTEEREAHVQVVARRDAEQRGRRRLTLVIRRLAVEGM